MKLVSLSSRFVYHCALVYVSITHHLFLSMWQSWHWCIFPSNVIYFFQSTVHGQLLTHSVSIMNISVCSKCKPVWYVMVA